jgi:ribosome biogenesis GTPase
MNCFIDPILDLYYIDKFLFCANVKNIPISLVFNKTDLLSELQFAELQNIAKIYEKIGYPVLLTSIKYEKSIDKIENTAKNKISVFAGQSGVGKSSIMRILFPDKYFAVQELSSNSLRGKNTTSHTSLLQLKNGGYVADTPGFSIFEMPNISPQFVASYFPDFVEILEISSCKFSNCSHKNEPDCCIKAAVEKGRIAKSRYESFSVIFNDMTAKAKKFR